MITYIISTTALIISGISLAMNYKANKNNERNRDVERYVLHYRDKIRDILEEFLEVHHQVWLNNMNIRTGDDY